MLNGETTKRSDLDPGELVARLQARGVEQLRDEAAIWVVFDGTDLRKPHAERMACLQRVKRLDRQGTMPGYPTLNVLGIGTSGRRGLLYHKLYSSAAPGFLSEPAEVRAAIGSVGAALAPLGADLTAIYDSGFDDQAVWGETWDQGMHLVCRLKHRDRLVRPASDQPVCHLAELAPRLKALAHVEAEMVVQKSGQPRPKLQPVTATVSSAPVRVPYRRAGDGEDIERERACRLVEVRLERVKAEPWWLLTDRPVETAEQATEVVRMVLPALGDRRCVQNRQTVLGVGRRPGPGLRGGAVAGGAGLGGGGLPLRAGRDLGVAGGAVATAAGGRRGTG